jgi:NAD(P)-dependent dehydrogenase (short-subunit alcohol dehydrogenase family)
VAAEIVASGGEAVAEYSDAADPVAGEGMVAAAMERWGRLDVCVANAAIGVGGMFHKQPAAQFDEVLEVNLHGAIRLVRAAMAVMRPAGFGRIILVASTGGLHGNVGPFRLRREQGRPARVRPVAGGRRRQQGRPDEHAAAVRAALMLATFMSAMRTRVHAIMDTIWPLGFVLIAAVSVGRSAGDRDSGDRWR